MQVARRVFDKLLKTDQDKTEEKLLQPLQVVKDFPFDSNRNKYPQPFVSEKEAWDELLNGSESTVLYSPDDETIYSRAFVQCGGALVRNRRTGAVFLIHESNWSTAAQCILEAQRKDDFDVIIMNARSGHMKFSRIKDSHKGLGMNGVSVAPKNVFLQEGEEHWALSSSGGKYFSENPREHMVRDGSRIKGISLEELQALHEDSQRESSQGKSELIGKIDLPERVAKWSLTYRPKENVIMIFAHDTNELYYYPAFPPLKKKA
jgi:hypothetical protein